MSTLNPVSSVVNEPKHAYDLTPPTCDLVELVGEARGEGLLAALGARQQDLRLETLLELVRSMS